MTPAEVGKEIAFPIVQPVTLIPILVTWLLFTVALFFGVFGGLLFLATLFPFMGYLMRLLDARAANRDAPVFDAELMQFFGTPISLFPMLFVAGFFWLSYLVMRSAGADLGWIFVIAWTAFFPASLSVLAMTRSPLQSLNPVALVKLMKATAADYFVMIIVLQFIGGVLIRTQFLDESSGFRTISVVYFLFLTYSYTGAITGRNKIAEQIDIPAPLPVSEEHQRKSQMSDRENVANHAYGFASRGNRQGAFEHVEAHVEGESDPNDARTWFFNKMMTWDDRDIALFYAQICLHHMLAEDRDQQALKMLNQCLHQNPRFRPQRDDRAAALELVQRHGRDDLARQLK